MENLLIPFAIVFISWMAGGIVSGITGAGSVMIAFPVMTLVIPANHAVLLATIIGMYGVVQLAWIYRKETHWDDIKDIVFGTVPGCLIGTYILKETPLHVLQALVGSMLLLFVFLRAFETKHFCIMPDSRILAISAGTLCGIASSALSMAGAPLAIYVLLKNWQPNRARGNLSAYFLVSNALSLAAQALSGMYTTTMIPTAVFGITGCIIGQIIGVCIGRNINKVFFQKLFLLMVTISAAVLLYRSTQ